MDVEKTVKEMEKVIESSKNDPPPSPETETFFKSKKLNPKYFYQFFLIPLILGLYLILIFYILPQLPKYEVETLHFGIHFFSIGLLFSTTANIHAWWHMNTSFGVPFPPIYYRVGGRIAMLVGSIGILKYLYFYLKYQ